MYIYIGMFYSNGIFFWLDCWSSIMFFYLFVSVFIETINEKQISLGRGYKTFLFKYQWPKVLSWLFYLGET